MDTNTRNGGRGLTPSSKNGETETSAPKENPLKQTATRLESIRQGLKDLMNDVNLALAHVKTAERDQKNSEKEFDSVRSTLRSLQKVQI